MTTSAGIAAAGGRKRQRAIWVVGLLVVLVFSAWLRCRGLGARSLWYDEFSTWHVSRMGLVESLRWLPEVKMAPLYQLCLRGLSDDARPAEWVLRLPAALAGVLVVLAGFWLGKLAGGWGTGLALAMLLACNRLQLQYSQEARSYTMLVLGGLLSTGLWYRLVRQPRWRWFCAYVVTATLTLHAHYLAALTLVAHAAWWAWVRWFGSAGRRALRPPAAWLVTAVLCAPVVLRYFHFRSPVYSGLEWIPPLTWGRAAGVLGQLTFGPAWMVMLLGALVLGVLARRGRCWGGRGGAADDSGDSAPGLCGLLALWFALAYGGLVFVSLVVQPLLVARYALPAAVPALLVPLMIAQRLERRLPLLIAAVFLAGTAPAWARRPAPWPGFRELAQYLNRHVERGRDAVVLVIYDTSHPDVVECERLGFAYYPLDGGVVDELWIGPDRHGSRRAILQDPRSLYLVVFQGTPLPLVEAAGRRLLPFVVAGRPLSRLYFEPYRLLHVAPLESR